jgi:trk system potassium uptake protein TrkH
LVGAIILTILFASNGFAFGEALWKGIFTAISAFCNAGFALQSDSLIPFQQQPLILHTIAFLIISGGIAPAVALLVPSWLRGKPITVASRLALSATLILLFTGTVFFLAFEWNGSLAGMTSIDKIHNAWFQSVTLRTAGFNSVPLENVLGPTFMMMICLMFIGGSPGGTAGGVKTTTIGVLAATFWSTASGYEDVAMQNRRIPAQTVFKAVTIVASGTMMLILVILMLEATQSINARDLIFEAASALGTVGLTTGATAKLDNIGKIIIMFAMFVGRIGPLTLFTLLSREHYENSENLLEARINLT